MPQSSSCCAEIFSAAAAGCARVAGDEEEDDIDDVENELNFAGRERQRMAEAMLHGHMSYGRHSDVHQADTAPPQLPLLTNGEIVRSSSSPSSSPHLLL